RRRRKSLLAPSIQRDDRPYTCDDRCLAYHSPSGHGNRVAPRTRLCGRRLSRRVSVLRRIRSRRARRGADQTGRRDDTDSERPPTRRDHRGPEGNVNTGAATGSPPLDEAGQNVQLANGSGRSWKCTTLLVVPLPPSIWNGARVEYVAQSPFPFQPAFG